MNRKLRLACAAGAVILVGCQAGPLDHPADPQPVGAEAGRSLNVPGAPATRGDRPGPALPRPEGDVSLRQALAWAVAHSPRLSAYATDVRIAEAQAVQAGLWPNAEVGLEIENVGGSGPYAGFDAAETTLSLAQTFPLGGDVARRRGVAAAQTQLASWDYEAARLEVLLEATQRFVSALAADRRIALAQQELELAKATALVTDRRIEAGDASPVDKARVQVPVITADVALRRARREKDAALRRLVTTWGGREVAFTQVSGDLDAIDAPPAPEALVALINQNPTAARWSAEVSRRLAEQRLAQAEAMPDLTGRIGVRHHNDDDEVSLVVGVSLPLPLFDRRQGDVLAARLGDTAARQRQREAELRIESMLSVAYAELAGSYDEALALRQSAIPAAAQAHQATSQAFNEGQLAFLDVLDAQRTLFELQQRYVAALVSYHTAAAEIESLIGRPLSELKATTNHTQPQGEAQP